MIFPRTDIFDLWKVKDVNFWPLFRQELSRQAGGRSQTKDLGSSLWRGSFATAPIGLLAAGPAEAALISLSGSGGSFLAYDMRRPFPRAYPAGDFSDTGAIGALDAGNTFMLSLVGLPAGFQLTAGDYLSFEYGAQPSRALHMVQDPPPPADGTGTTASFEVHPAIRPGALVGTPVALKRASCEMILEPGQAPPKIANMVASEVSFTAIQIF